MKSIARLAMGLVFITPALSFANATEGQLLKALDKILAPSAQVACEANETNTSNYSLRIANNQMVKIYPASGTSRVFNLRFPGQQGIVFRGSASNTSWIGFRAFSSNKHVCDATVLLTDISNDGKVIISTSQCGDDPEYFDCVVK